MSIGTQLMVASMRISFGVILALSLNLLNLSSTAWADNVTTGPAPTKDLQPADVIEIVVDALRTNDSGAGDQGIATVWRFAAPSNKAITGPLARFTLMLKGGFGDMLNHLDSDYGPLDVEDDLALQPVWLVTSNGDEVGYMFELRRQGAGDFDGMWMTEAVYPISPKKPGTTI